MEFKSVSCPERSRGVSFVGVKRKVVPNQAMSLQEILERFTRGELLEVGKEYSYDDGPEDLEKIQHADLTEREEFIESQREIARNYDKQEKRKAKEEKERLEKLAVEKLANDKLAAEKAGQAAK